MRLDGKNGLYQLLRDARTILLSLLAIILVVIACILLLFIMGTYNHVGATYRAPELSGTLLFYRKIDRKDFNREGQPSKGDQE